MVMKLFVYLFYASINLHKKFGNYLMMFNYILNYMLI
jgi:hypothetical protein